MTWKWKRETVCKSSSPVALGTGGFSNVLFNCILYTSDRFKNWMVIKKLRMLPYFPGNLKTYWGVHPKSWLSSGHVCMNVTSKCWETASLKYFYSWCEIPNELKILYVLDHLIGLRSFFCTILCNEFVRMLCRSFSSPSSVKSAQYNIPVLFLASPCDCESLDAPALILLTYLLLLNEYCVGRLLLIDVYHVVIAQFYL